MEFIVLGMVHADRELPGVRSDRPAKAASHCMQATDGSIVSAYIREAIRRAEEERPGEHITHSHCKQMLTGSLMACCWNYLTPRQHQVTLPMTTSLQETVDRLAESVYDLNVAGCLCRRGAHRAAGRHCASDGERPIP